MKYITPEGFNELKKELDERLEKRKKIAKAIKQAKEQGDLSENAEYSQAKSQQGENERRINWLQRAIKGSKVAKKTKGDTIGVGSTVKIKNGGNIIEILIVGTHETNPTRGKISCESPLGKALVGQTKGDKVTVETPSGKQEFKITEVN